MNITSILLKKVILEGDSDTWAKLQQHYLPTEHQKIYQVINSYFEAHKGLPSFEALKLSTRSNAILDKIFAIEAAQTVELENSQLLEFLKNEYTQEEILDQITRYISDSIMMESAAENLERLHSIIIDIEGKVDLKDPSVDMAKIELFLTEDELAKAFALGLNDEYDKQMRFVPGDYILLGGKRGHGKSLTCANVVVNQYKQHKSSIYFTIEMSARATLQRLCSISTGVSASALRTKNLSLTDWQAVAKWWAYRFQGGDEAYKSYMNKHNSFDTLHKDLTKLVLNPECQLDVVYDPKLSIAKIKSELDKKVERIKPSVVVIDYVNQVKRNSFKGGQYDWTEQIEVSKAIKEMAQEYELPIVSPYQIDSTGEARFSKGLLDSCDAAFTLNAWKKEDECITFTCVKMRDYDEVDFTSKMNWSNLRIGPESADVPETKKQKTQEEASDME